MPLSGPRQLEARRDELDFVRGYTEYALNAIFFENYWNDGSPVRQERYFDNIVVATEPIGCGEVGRPTTTPAPSSTPTEVPRSTSAPSPSADPAASTLWLPWTAAVPRHERGLFDVVRIR